jgi:MFS family permease
MQAVSLGILVTARTHNPLWTGLVAAAAFLPNGLLAPVGGALADRLDRRRWLLLTTVAETFFAALLAVLAASGHADPAVVVPVAFGGGCAAAIGFPAYQAMLPDLVGRDDLLAAVSLSSAQFNLGRVIGPALAGIVLVLGSYSLAFAVNAVSFGAVIIALLLLRLPPPVRHHGDEGLFTQIASGARTAMAEPGCRSAVLLIAVVALLASPFIALVPAMAIDGLGLHTGHSGAVGTSVLVTAQGVGAVTGALTLPSLARRFGRGRLVVGALFLLPVLLVLYGLAPVLVLSALALLLVGCGYIGVLSGLNTVIQLRAPAAWRGRVLSFFMFALGTVYPLAAVLQGGLGRIVGVRAVTIGAAVLLLGVLAILAAVRPGVFAALGDPKVDHRLDAAATG